MTTLDQAVDKLEALITGPGGELLPDRIEFERLEGGRVRWNLWQGSRRLYSAAGRASDLPGLMAASQMILADER